MTEWRGRVFRDPIHGDVRLGPVQSEIVDTTLFQRLRFIRQNGLLHLVFPGAMHTRFAHSIGTAHVAQRVFSRLFPDYSPYQAYRPAHRGTGLTYVGSVFVSAALLHDLGHCAFSHSIEQVNTESNEPFLPALKKLAETWQEEIPGLKTIWDKFFPTGLYEYPERTEHEHIGYLMICVLFSGHYKDVEDACNEVLKVSATDYCQDILSILIGGKIHKPSSHFIKQADDLRKKYFEDADISKDLFASDLIESLHGLISGTLDVDRLDYLLRDSHYIGVPYGLSDIEVLINGLKLITTKEDDTVRLVIALKERATRALDDMLWGRFQLFSQVLNHKTNVMLNALLADAIPEAVADNQIDFKQPKTFADFLLFTDDHVMSSVMKACIYNTQLTKKYYARALVHRELPVYLGNIDSSENENISKKTNELSSASLKAGCTEKDIKTWIVKSALLKSGGGTMPYVVRRNKITETEEALPPSTEGLYKLQEWCEKKMLPMEIQTCHFFSDSENIKPLQ